eukprot:1143438-Pelagomonas_calceolata.AAC.1
MVGLLQGLGGVAATCCSLESEPVASCFFKGLQHVTPRASNILLQGLGADGSDRTEQKLTCCLVTLKQHSAPVSLANLIHARHMFKSVPVKKRAKKRLTAHIRKWPSSCTSITSLRGPGWNVAYECAQVGLLNSLSKCMQPSGNSVILVVSGGVSGKGQVQAGAGSIKANERYDTAPKCSHTGNQSNRTFQPTFMFECRQVQCSVQVNEKHDMTQKCSPYLTLQQQRLLLKAGPALRCWPDWIAHLPAIMSEGEKEPLRNACIFFLYAFFVQSSRVGRADLRTCQHQRVMRKRNHVGMHKLFHALIVPSSCDSRNDLRNYHH